MVFFKSRRVTKNKNYKTKKIQGQPTTFKTLTFLKSMNMFIGPISSESIKFTDKSDIIKCLPVPDGAICDGANI
jgi:hypothetical protein